MTDRLLDYANHVARAVAAQYPDRIIVTLAYTNATSPPPTRVLPEPNVMVQYCPYPHRTACQSHDLTYKKDRQGLADLTGWIAKGPRNMHIFDDPCGYAVYHEPFGSSHAMKRKLDSYAEQGIRGIYYCGVPSTFRDLFVFVQSRLLWEPKAPVEPLIDELMAAYYGPAAPAMRQYVDRSHREVETRPVHQMCEGPNSGLVTPALAEEALALFAQAEKAARNDRAALYRVRQEKLNVLFADLNERNPANGRLAVPPDEFARRLGEFVAIGRAARAGNLLRSQKSAAEWLYKAARVRTTVSPWYADPLVSRPIECGDPPPRRRPQGRHERPAHRHPQRLPGPRCRLVHAPRMPAALEVTPGIPGLPSALSRPTGLSHPPPSGSALATLAAPPWAPARRQNRRRRDPLQRPAGRPDGTRFPRRQQGQPAEAFGPRQDRLKPRRRTGGQLSPSPLLTVLCRRPAGRHRLAFTGSTGYAVWVEWIPGAGGTAWAGRRGSSGSGGRVGQRHTRRRTCGPGWPLPEAASGGH